jgi:hypothetical protein
MDASIACMKMQVAEARKEVRDRQCEADVERTSMREMQSQADVLKADCATLLRAADALRAAITQHTAASSVLAQSKLLEESAASKHVASLALEQQAITAKNNVSALHLPVKEPTISSLPLSPSPGSSPTGPDTPGALLDAAYDRAVHAGIENMLRASSVCINMDG